LSIHLCIVTIHRDFLLWSSILRCILRPNEETSTPTTPIALPVLASRKQAKQKESTHGLLCLRWQSTTYLAMTLPPLGCLYVFLLFYESLDSQPTIHLTRKPAVFLAELFLLSSREALQVSLSISSNHPTLCQS